MSKVSWSKIFKVVGNLVFIYLGAFAGVLISTVGSIGCGDMASVEDSKVCMDNVQKVLPWLVAHGAAMGFLIFQLLSFVVAKFKPNR